MNTSKVVSACVLIGISIAACKKKSDNTPDAPVSYLQVIHTSPKTAELMVNVNEKKMQQKVQYLSVQKPYVSLNSGKDVPVKLTLGNNIVGENKFTFENATSYSLFIYDTLKNNKVKFIVLKDVLSNPGATKANVRFLHLSPNTTPVDIDVFKGNDSIRLVKATAYIGDNPDAAALAPFKTIIAGTYRVKVKIQVGAKPVTLLDIPSLKLEGQRTATIFLKGLTNGTADAATGLQLWLHK
ncbi:DUF4397 domain-containing protein [Chitinophaga sp. 22321]|uniref:DUF4397 domain-containing protein n=1 Tax=Chitinophaga hostae TaxID=2831022 RepID=A0ABS5J615_9BACT|nr:DUF4397 domain-containing protein [Chitinophaga hostae]MBS0030667.1 DUF4397 domain-containing protein [Chitinophaga hostae]